MTAFINHSSTPALYRTHLVTFLGTLSNAISKYTKLVPWGTDGRLPLSDLDLDLASGHTAYRRASLIDLYVDTKFH